MSDRCPYCSQPLTETVTNRVIGYLGNAGRPVSSAELRRELRVSETTMYQTTRRLRDRGAIEKSTTALGNGWVLTEITDRPADTGTTTPLSQDPQIQQWAQDLTAWMSTRSSVDPDEAHAWLVRLGATDEQAAFVVGAVWQDLS